MVVVLNLIFNLIFILFLSFSFMYKIRNYVFFFTSISVSPILITLIIPIHTILENQIISNAIICITPSNDRRSIQSNSIEIKYEIKIEIIMNTCIGRICTYTQTLADIQTSTKLPLNKINMKNQN